jgi:undecaprenyl-diphosphatase
MQGRLTTVWPISRYPVITDKGERFFRRHGGKSVIIGRFVGPVRPVIPLIAGALMMPWHRFLAFNIGSAVAWAPAYVFPGFLVGSALASGIRPPAHFYAVTGISLSALLIVYFVLLRFQLGLGEEGRFYQWLKQWMGQYAATHRFWRLYTNQRPAREGEFPLASFTLALGATALLLIWGQLATNTHLLDGFNQATLHWFEQLRQPLLDGPFIAFTLLGDPPVLIAAGILACVALLFKGYYAAAAHVLRPENHARRPPAGRSPESAGFRRLPQRAHGRHHADGYPAGQFRGRRNPEPQALAILRHPVTSTGACGPEPALPGGSLVYGCYRRDSAWSSCDRGGKGQLQPV